MKILLVTAGFLPDGLGGVELSLARFCKWAQAQGHELLVYRREIAQVSEWPFNAGVATRLVFYLVIPPLTWVAAGLIDVLIERMV